MKCPRPRGPFIRDGQAAPRQADGDPTHLQWASRGGGEYVAKPEGFEKALFAAAAAEAYAAGEDADAAPRQTINVPG